MKYSIIESKLNKIINDVISKCLKRHFGNLTHQISKADYHMWLSDKWEDPNLEVSNMPLHKNFWGKLWIESCEFYEDLMSDLSMFSMDKEEKENVFKEYMNKKYGVNIKALGIEIYC